MSGTSVDGIDAALVEIKEHENAPIVKLKKFICHPIPREVKEKILNVAGGEFGGAREICFLQERLGKLYADACAELCREAGVPYSEIAFVGCHGQTVWHQPEPVMYAGELVRGSLQIGDPSFINEVIGCPVVSDFRLRDMAAGGQGAPIVPYVEALLYKGKVTRGFLNIGGIANITIVPKEGSDEKVVAFDTGPGNMLINAMVKKFTYGEMDYDKDGEMAGSGSVNEDLLKYLMEDPYLEKEPPKSTGREKYGEKFLDKIYDFCSKKNITEADAIATVTMYTAKCVSYEVEHYVSDYPKELIVSGGGSHNKVIMAHLKKLMKDSLVMTGEEFGIDADSKEAVSMAVLAYETINGRISNVPSVTGADHPVVMGKISY